MTEYAAPDAHPWRSTQAEGGAANDVFHSRCVPQLWNRDASRRRAGEIQVRSVSIRNGQICFPYPIAVAAIDRRL
jgi:hypothetical protein